MKKRKKPFLTIKTRIFQSPKITFFFKGINPWFWPKMLFFLYFDFIKIRLEIMLSDIQEKKQNIFGHKKTVRIFEIFFTIKKKTFWKSQKSLFSIVVNPCFWSKNANFFVYVDFVKIRLEIMLVTSHRKKKSFGL